MTTSPGPTTLGTHMKRRRLQLDIRFNAAYEAAGVSKSTWANWEKDRNLPEEFNYKHIERVLLWEPGSVKAAVDGGEPTPAAGNVVQLRPSNVPEDDDEDDETIRQLRNAAIADDLRALLIENYRAEKARVAALRRREDDELRRRYLKTAEAAGE